MGAPREALLRHADAALRKGAHAEALAAYASLVDQFPDSATAWYNLGYLHRRRGEFAAALKAYACALEQGIERPEEIHLNRAAIFSDHLRRDDIAEAELNKALSNAPHYAPAWLNLGNLHEECGRQEKAMACYRQLLASSDQGLASVASALQGLARLLELQLPQPDPELLERLITQARNTPMDPAERASLWFALGRIHDHQGRHDDAFAAFTIANQLAHVGTPAPTASQGQQYIDALIAGFPTRNPAPTIEAPDPQPLFVCGMFRSGSTLVEQILSMHSQVIACGELDLLPRLVQRHAPGFPASTLNAPPSLLEELRLRYLQARDSMIPPTASTRYVIDKRPDNYLLIGLIKQLFPSARIVHTIRAPLDNGLSIFMQHLNPRAFPYAGDLRTIGDHFMQYRRLMQHWRSIYPEAIHDFDYDAFVANPETELSALMNFLDLDGEQDCLRFHEAKNTVKTASLRQVRQPLYRSASGRWQRYAHHLKPLHQALGIPE